MQTFSTKSFSRKSIALAVIASTLLGGGAMLSAQAAGGGHRGGGMHGGEMMFMHRGMDRMLDSIGATDEQKAQIEQIREAARADLKAQREAAPALRDQARDLFVQPTIDAGAAEALRQQMLAQFDQASQRRMQVMLDISRVLTPEQRQQIAERLQERAERRAEHRRGDRR